MIGERQVGSIRKALKTDGLQSHKSHASNCPLDSLVPLFGGAFEELLETIEAFQCGLFRFGEEVFSSVGEFVGAGIVAGFVGEG